jgi:hypothetical protein
MHCVATAMGVMVLVEAVIAREPWIFVGGIVLAYSLAIPSHRAIERNQPLIAVAPIWGAVADLRLAWLAVTGGLEREYSKRGLPVADKRVSETRTVGESASPIILALDEFDHVANCALNYYERRSHRYALLFVSAAGLLVVLADLHDVVEPTGKPAYPIVQLGLPILAFATALVLCYAATLAGTRLLRTILDWFEALKRNSQSDSAAAAEIEYLKRTFDQQAANEASLWRASVVQLALGAAIFAAAETAELIMAPAVW